MNGEQLFQKAKLAPNVKKIDESEICQLPLLIIKVWESTKVRENFQTGRRVDKQGPREQLKCSLFRAQ